MQYTVNGTTYDSNSGANEKILNLLISRNIYADVTDMINDLMDAKTEGWDFYDFDNAMVEVSPCCHANFSDAFETDLEAIKKLEGDNELTLEEIYLTDYYICDECGEAFYVSDAENESANPTNYYIVDSWFGEKLRDYGEMVLERDGGWIWGRQGGGQLIAADYVIAKLAYEHGILDGQEYSWADKV